MAKEDVALLTALSVFAVLLVAGGWEAMRALAFMMVLAFLLAM